MPPCASSYWARKAGRCWVKHGAASHLTCFFCTWVLDNLEFPIAWYYLSTGQPLLDSLPITGTQIRGPSRWKGLFHLAYLCVCPHLFLFASVHIPWHVLIEVRGQPSDSGPCLSTAFETVSLLPHVRHACLSWELPWGSHSSLGTH